VLEQQVVVLADGPADEVLDRHDAAIGLAALDGLEHLAEATDPAARHVAERREDRVLRERAGLAGKRDRHLPNASFPTSFSD
jgi:hypothetical protein